MASSEAGRPFVDLPGSVVDPAGAEKQQRCRRAGVPVGYYRSVSASYRLQAGLQLFSYALLLVNDQALTHPGHSNTYWDGVLNHQFLIYEMQAIVAAQIQNFVKFPPRQKPAAFNLDEVLRHLREASGGANH